MSNYLNFSVQSESQIMDWVVMQMGWPLVTPDIHEDQLRMCINDAVEEFTKYATQEIEYLALDLEDYNTSGFTLDGNVTSIFALEESTVYGNTTGGVNTLFSVQNSMWNSGVMPIPGFGGGGTWVDYELAMQYVDMVNVMTAAKFYFEFNERDQLLTLIPNPTLQSMSGYIVVGCNTIRPDVQQYGESWVKRYTLACAKVVIGNIRSLYEGTQLVGGGAINSSIKEEGLQEKEALLEELRATYTFVNFFKG